jgi:hypothetical protein
VTYVDTTTSAFITRGIIHVEPEKRRSAVSVCVTTAVCVRVVCVSFVKCGSVVSWCVRVFQTRMLSLLLVTLAIVFALATATADYHSAVCNHFKAPVNGLFRSCELVKGRQVTGSHGNGLFLDDVETTGWGKLWIHGDDTLQGSYEGGFVEGTLTQTRIYQHYVSWFSKTFSSAGPTDSTKKFMRDNYDFMVNLANSTANPEQGITEEYLSHLRHTVAQFEGVVAGYQSVAPSDQPMTLDDFLLLEAAGDMYDIIPATNPSEFKLNVGKLSAREFEDEFHKMVSCSAIIKVRTSGYNWNELQRF